MGVTTLFLSLAALIVLSLGVVVFANNYIRKANQAFLVASTFMLLWLTSNLLITYARTAETAHRLLNLAFFLAACIPTAFQFLRLSIKHPESNWLTIFKKCRVHILANATISLICFHPAFIKSVTIALAKNGMCIATPEYGFLYGIWNAYFLSAIIFFAYTLYKDRGTLAGTQRIELDFLGFACIAGLVVGLLFGTVFALLTKSNASVPVAHAISVLTLVIIVAYGISTKHILDVGTVIRKIAAYALLTSYLVIVYLGIWILAKHVLFKFVPNSDLLAQITAAVIVAFSMAPVHGRFQKVASKLVTSHAMDVPSTMKRAGDIFQSVTTIDALLQQFSDLLMAALSADDMRILLAEDSGYVQQYPKQGSDIGVVLPMTSAVAEMIRKTKDTVCGDTLVRMRKTPIITNVLHELNELSASVVTGVFAKAGLHGVVLFGSRRGGRIYDKNEQDALQILGNQFAVALENAQLYTEMQDSKIRNEIMLDQLVSGVIVADPERKIALINNEAQRITGLTEKQALGQGIGLLPESISGVLETTLATQRGLQNTNAVLLAQEEGESTHVRMGSAYLLGHDEKPMGALLVFTDLTEVKGLEEQVRRADQLSSVGTLAAGMAHEIKNPLVTIKTFAQLLTERYGDADFRKDFSSLVTHEVSRIDSIVNQLLSFSKPRAPNLVPMKLHDTVEKTLKLVHEQLSQKNIALNNGLRARHDLISGDADLLTQTLVNFNLNAIEAIETDGTINVTSSNCTYRFVQGDNPDDAISKSCIRVQISDTGKGIERDQLQKIFDPFFTSKSEGTGMGLSVAHGIIQEHHGAIEVESRPGKGTTFSIYLPILEEDAAA